MTRIYKISIFLSMITLILVVGNFALAQNKGYFLEKGSELFIFDSLYVNGYLIVEDTLSQQKGALGDVLVEKEFILDKKSKFYFCKNEIDPITQLKGNRLCARQVMIWHPAEVDLGLEVVNQAVSGTSLYQINVGQIIVDTISGEINFEAGSGKEIITNDAVKISGCFSNDGSEFCLPDSLKTTNLYLNNENSLFSLNARQTPIAKNQYQVIINPNNAIFNTIDLGPEANIDNQNLCWFAAGNDCGNVARGGKDIFQNPNLFVSKANVLPGVDVRRYVPVPGVPYLEDFGFGFFQWITPPPTFIPISKESFFGLNNTTFNKICCYLDINF